jgi:glycosyltransferase involved in cell wall biosynthesis
LNSNKKIKILHVIEKLNDHEGGLYNVVYNLCKFLTNVDNFILTSQIKKISIIKKFTYKILKTNSLFECYKILSDHKIDLIHIHGIWSPINTFIALIAAKKKIPYLVSTHGMLEPWSLQQRYLKKKIFLFLFWKTILKKANKILFTSRLEYLNFKRLNLINNMNYSIIRNGFYIPTKLIKKNSTVNKKLIFLSRIHEKKGISDLINVFKEIDPLKWHLNIAGSGNPHFIEKLKAQCGEEFLNKKIFFLGFQNELQKVQIFNNSNVFVLPSYSENFGIVIVEALGCGLPVITTTATPWSLVKKNNCGWWIKTGKRSLKKCLNTVFKTSDSKFKQMSMNAKRLSINFKWQRVSREIRSLYSEILGY